MVCFVVTFSQPEVTAAAEKHRSEDEFGPGVCLRRVCQPTIDNLLAEGWRKLDDDRLHSIDQLTYTEDSGIVDIGCWNLPVHGRC